MSNRAIRNSKLNFDTMNKDKYEVFQALNEPLNNASDMTVWQFIQEAATYDVEIGGINAYQYRQKVQNLTQAVTYDGLHNTLSHMMNVILTELIEKAMTPNRRATLLDGITRMRNQLVNNPDLRWGFADNHPNFNKAFADQQQDTFNLLKEVSDEVVSKFKVKNNYGLVQTRWYHNMFHASTDDAYLEQMATNPCTYFFTINSGYLIPYVHFQSSYNSTQMVELEDMMSLTDDEMEDVVLTLKEKHPRLHLEIASIHEFALANPQVASLAQSWTSRYSHAWCFFKQHYSDISKKNTLSCGLISDLFGKHTPTFAGLKSDWEQKMIQILDDIKKAEPVLENAKKIDEENQNKTAENIEKAITAKLNEMLNGNDDEQSDALTLIGNLAGIQGHQLSQNHTTTYYDVAHAQDQNLYLHWNALLQYEVSMDNISLTDKQQMIITSRYHLRQQEMTDAHARTCAQLARQIARQTTQHDEQMAAMRKAFNEYQALV